MPDKVSIFRNAAMIANCAFSVQAISEKRIAPTQFVSVNGFYGTTAHSKMRKTALSAAKRKHPALFRKINPVNNVGAPG